jgi:hypothetical protein
VQRRLEAKFQGETPQSRGGQGVAHRDAQAPGPTSLSPSADPVGQAGPDQRGV